MSKLFKKAKPEIPEEIILTPEEIELVVDELSERVKDMAYMTCKSKVRAMLSGCKIYDMSSGDSLTLTWKLDLVHGDILQIVGRNRRKDEDNRV